MLGQKGLAATEKLSVQKFPMSVFILVISINVCVP